MNAKKLIAAAAAGFALVLALPSNALAFKEVDPAPAASAEVSVDNPDYLEVSAAVQVSLTTADGSESR
jgi:hypothetical protein